MIWNVQDFLIKGNIHPYSLLKKARPIGAEPTYPIPPFNETDVNLVHSWKAHNDAITTFHLVPNPPALITGSRDQRIRAWSRTGVYYGTLRQASGEGWGGGKWAFPVDSDSLEKSKAAHAQQILDSIDKQAIKHPRPNMESAFLRRNTNGNMKKMEMEALRGTLPLLTLTSPKKTAVTLIRPYFSLPATSFGGPRKNKKEKLRPATSALILSPQQYLTESQQRASLRLSRALDEASNLNVTLLPNASK